MTFPVSQIAGISTPLLPAAIAPGQPAQPGVFQSVLKDSLSAVENTQTAAHASIGRFLSGDGEELHHVAIATQQAELNFELFMQVRNKVVQAYQDIMRMQM